LATELEIAPGGVPGKFSRMNVCNSGIPPGNSSDDPGGEMFDASCPTQLAGAPASANAGPATAMINAMTNATVDIKVERLMSATSSSVVRYSRLHHWLPTPPQVPTFYRTWI
jgi:hypothetical protein